MKSVFLIDGGFFIHKLREFRTSISPEDIVRLVHNVRGLYDSDYHLLRIYYYDCAPSDAKTETPILRSAVDYKATPQFKKQMEFLSRLRRTDYVSVREGRLIFRGWSLKKSRMFTTTSVTASNPLSDSDFQPDFEPRSVWILPGSAWGGSRSAST